MVRATEMLRPFKHLFEKLSRKRALRIAGRQVHSGQEKDFSVYDYLPGNTHIYMPTIDKPCWFVLCPWGDGQDSTMLRSSRLMVITRWGGKVIYDGSAGDEG